MKKAFSEYRIHRIVRDTDDIVDDLQEQLTKTLLSSFDADHAYANASNVCSILQDVLARYLRDLDTSGRLPARRDYT